MQVNGATVGVDYHVPFDGSEDTGIGLKVQGLAASNLYKKTRVILVSH